MQAFVLQRERHGRLYQRSHPKMLKTVGELNDLYSNYFRLGDVPFRVLNDKGMPYGKCH